MREARRRNAGYRSHAISSLGEIAAARTDVDLFPEVRDITRPILDELVDVGKGENVKKEDEGDQSVRKGEDG